MSAETAPATSSADTSGAGDSRPLLRAAEPSSFPDSPLAGLARQPFLLGLFLPLQTGGWSQSTLPRGTDWTFEYNKGLVLDAEAYGVDIAFGLSQWLPKGGFGGEMHYRENFLDPFVSAVALSAVTSKIMLFGTIHVLYGPWHPLHLAKFLATADHISGGRFGANIVTGYASTEPLMFGMERAGHDDRYAMADEFIAICEDLWRGDDNLTYRGRYWNLENAYVSPRPRFGRPPLVSASGSPAGFAYAGKHSDIVFTASPAGERFEDAIVALPELTSRIKRAAEDEGRKVRVLINATVVSRDSDADADAYRNDIIEHADLESIRNFQSRHAGGDSRSWQEHTAKGRALGGHLHLIGSPETIADQIGALKEAGIDGVELSFYDYGPDLRQFGNDVLPLLIGRGLRVAE